jgi:hypothetical protein
MKLYQSCSNAMATKRFFYRNLKKFSCKKSKELELRYLAVDVYQVCSNKSPRVKIGHTPGVIDFPYMYIVKTLKKLLVKILKR